jgi:protein TonB
MFEDSLVESQHRLSSPNQRWTTALSLTLQCSIVAAVVALPLLHPESMPFRSDAPRIILPLKPIQPTPRSASASTASSPSPSPLGHPLTAPTQIAHLDLSPSDAPMAANLALTGGGMADPNAIPEGLASSPNAGGIHVVSAPASVKKGPIHISTGVMNGLLLAPIRPIYPRIAVSARIEGVVIVAAIITKSGQIESAHAISGPEMLRSAAIDAIRNARYSPYLLNGSPTDVETTITVNFRLGS